MTTKRFTHKGWFGLCPVYIAEPDSGMPCIDPRHGALAWLLTLSEVIFEGVFWCCEVMKPAADPMFPLHITGELPVPIERSWNDA